MCYIKIPLSYMSSNKDVQDKYLRELKGNDGALPSWAVSCNDLENAVIVEEHDAEVQS